MCWAFFVYTYILLVLEHAVGILGILQLGLMCTLSLYHQHYPTFTFNEHIRISHDHCKDLLGSHRLSILAQMKTLTVYHVCDLFCTHSSVACSQAVYYCFFYLHCSKIHNYDLVGEISRGIINE